MAGGKADIDPDLADLYPEEADETEELPFDLAAESEEAPAEGPLAAGLEVVRKAARHAPTGPGVYRMIDASGEVLYVGKAKSIAKRVISYTRTNGLVSRIARMVAQTTAMEFVSTATETEALLLEANLIKQLRPRFNVLLRDDKSFPYILISGEHPAPRIAKHRGARNIKGDYFGPFASASAVGRTINALERAFLIRSCTDAVYESRTRPCLLHQIKRCAAPCTGEIDKAGYDTLVAEAKDFLSGRSTAVKQLLANEMEQAAADLEFERAAVYRDRLSALSAIQSTQGINPRGVEEADVFACHQEGGQTCIEVFFFRTGQNWGNRAYYPKADRSLEPAAVLGSFIAQFYDDKPAPSLVLLSHETEDQALLAEALSTRTGRRVQVATPKRGEKRDLVEHAEQNAREALGRKLAESASQTRLLTALGEVLGLAEPPKRIEVYDNSHIMGTNAVGGMIVSGPDGFAKKEYRTFTIKSDIAPGDDFGMMREVLERRFKRLISEKTATEPTGEEGGEAEMGAWPDLVLIDGGQGQLKAARDVLTALGVSDVPVVGVAKGRDREAGRETFVMEGRAPFRLEPRDPVLYFVQRLRDEAHRFAIGAHRGKRKKDIREAGLAEVTGVGPARKRALLNHFGTLKAIERASHEDLMRAPGINAATAKAVYDFFRPGS